MIPGCSKRPSARPQQAKASRTVFVRRASERSENEAEGFSTSCWGGSHESPIGLPPYYFSIDYEINPWDVPFERSQFERGRPVSGIDPTQVLEQDAGAVLERMKPVPGLPDLVFISNAGIVVGTQERCRAVFVMPSGGRKRRILKNGFVGKEDEVVTLDPGRFFEGAGDLLGFPDTWFGRLSAAIGYPCVPRRSATGSIVEIIPS